MTRTPEDRPQLTEDEDKGWTPSRRFVRVGAVIVVILSLFLLVRVAIAAVQGSLDKHHVGSVVTALAFILIAIYRWYDADDPE